MTSHAPSISNLDIYDSDAQTLQAEYDSTQLDTSGPNTHVLSPRKSSWYSHDEERSSRTLDDYSDLNMMQTPDYASQPADYNATSQKFETWRASTATVFPVVTSDMNFCVAENARDQPRYNESKPSESESFFRKRFERAKVIYRNGPPGEGQVFWTGVRNYLKERETGAVLEMYPPKPTGESVRMASPESIISWQMSGQPSEKPLAMPHDIAEDVGKPRARHDSLVSCGDISRTSREVPIKIQRTILTVDTNKPLPPRPLSVIPKLRLQEVKGRVLDVNKPLPRTPFPSFSDPPTPSEEDIAHFTVDPPLPNTYVEKVGLDSTKHATGVPMQTRLTHKERPDTITRETQTPIRPKRVAKKTSKARLKPTDKSKPNKADKAHDALKGKISRPTLILPVVNPCPIHLEPYNSTTGDNAKGKHKIPPSPIWLNKLAHPTMPGLHKPKKRPKSDESWVCQGLEDESESSEFDVDDGLSVQDGGPRMRVEEDCEEMLRPAPLFSGGRSDGGCDAGDDGSAGKGRTGRWI